MKRHNQSDKPSWVKINGRLFRLFESCKTKEHEEVALKYIALAMKRYDFSPIEDELEMAYHGSIHAFRFSTIHGLLRRFLRYGEVESDV